MNDVDDVASQKRRARAKADEKEKKNEVIIHVNMMATKRRMHKGEETNER